MEISYDTCDVAFLMFASAILEFAKTDVARPIPEIANSRFKYALRDLTKWQANRISAYRWATIDGYHYHEGVSFKNICRILLLDEEAEREHFTRHLPSIQSFDIDELLKNHKRR
jgi:hypothetical protein